MKKWLVILLIMLPIVTATICEDRLDNGMTCRMLTPEISCTSYTYDIYLKNGSPTAYGSALTHLNGSIYYFNFSNQTGDYIVRLCDGTTREFRVTESYDKKFEKEENARMYIAAIIGLSITLAFFIYLAYHFKNDYDDMGDYKPWVAPIRFIFIGLAVYTAMGVMRIGVDLLNEAGQTSMFNIANTMWMIFLAVFSFVFFIILFLYGIRFMWSLVRHIKYGNEGEEEF